MARTDNSSTKAQNDSNVYMPGMPTLSVVEAVGSKLFRRRGSLERVPQDE
jgi:hypothetical protein